MPKKKLPADRRRQVISIRLRGDTIKVLDAAVALRAAVDRTANRSTVVEGYILKGVRA